MEHNLPNRIRQPHQRVQRHGRPVGELRLSRCLGRRQQGTPSLPSIRPLVSASASSRRIQLVRNAGQEKRESLEKMREGHRAQTLAANLEFDLESQDRGFLECLEQQTSRPERSREGEDRELAKQLCEALGFEASVEASRECPDT